MIFSQNKKLFYLINSQLFIIIAFIIVPQNQNKTIKTKGNWISICKIKGLLH